MTWQTIDFHRMVDLDRKIVFQLEQFLEEKEKRLAKQVLDVIPPSYSEDLAAPSMLSETAPLKLLEAVEGFSKRVRGLNPSQIDPKESQSKVGQDVKEINAILWEFIEVLEGCVSELFQQVRQVPIDRWHLYIAQVVQEIKNVLNHYIEDLSWTIRRLEKPLKEYCQKFNYHFDRTWLDRILFRDAVLDPNLLHNLNETETFLKSQYEAFQQHYNEFMQVNIKTEESLQKMKSYPILSLLDLSEQNLYIDAYRLLNMIELNPNPKKEVSIDTTKALKNLTSFDNIFQVMNIYLFEIKETLFISSLEWKSMDRKKENFQENQDRLKFKIVDFIQELKDLSKTMSRYRTFILKNDPNPYIRSRWGFSEWIVGPEPAKAKKMLNLIYSAEELERNFKRFQEVLDLDPEVQQKQDSDSRQEIEKLLHEIKQPLISRSMMHQRMERILNELKICDEIGNPHLTTISYFEDTLSKIMREDWRYHVLHEFPLFHHIYHLHQGLVDPYDDPAHAFRLERFQLFFDQIEGWVEKEDVYAHVHEIQLDINDMKTYLQDFLATVQRTVKDKSHDPFLDESLFKFRHQLLEYRYIFGRFFLYIMSKNSDGMQLRNQFLFVNQYFESVENLINEMKLSAKGLVES